MQNYYICEPVAPEELKAYYSFRWQCLRQPLNMPPGSEQDDNEDGAYHCMAIAGGQNVFGVGRIHQESPGIMQIRYMAVGESMQGEGVGSAILAKLITHAKQQHAKSCWLNAREEACGFYQKHGFEIVGAVETGLNIPHYRMEKRF